MAPCHLFDACVSIKVNKVAISKAQENAAPTGIRNRNFVAASAKAIFLSKVPVSTRSGINDSGEEDNGGNNDEKKSSGLLVRDFPRDTTVVVVNPPRKGCLVEFLDQLNKYQPTRVVYMS